MGEGMTFYDWIMQARLSVGPTRDLRDDIKRDKSFPSEIITWERLKNYLAWAGACDEAIDAARVAFKSYRANIRSKK